MTEENKAAVRKEKKKMENAQETKKAEKKQKAATEKKEITGRTEVRQADEKELPAPVQMDDPFRILRFVLMTEKSVQVIEKQNKLVFIVDRGADKKNIKAAVESAFNAPITGVQTMIDQQGRKKAFVKFRNAGAAGDIAIKLGII